MALKLPFRHNPEKKFFEKWDDKRNLANFPHPYRMLVQGLPNCGKTSTILSVLAAAKPTWDHIIICHAKYVDMSIDSEEPSELEIAGKDVDLPEYNGIDFTCALKSIPQGYTYFKRFQDDKMSKKVCLIIDDVELREWCRAKRSRQISVNKLFSYQSTHHGLTIMVSCQDGTVQLPVGVRRECNVNVVFKGRDKSAIQYQAMSLGFSKYLLVVLFNLCKSNHDSITFDATDSTPATIRFNIINKIELDETE